MILPVVAFGSSILRKECEDVTQDYIGLDILVENMWETMYNASGVGLAAPQVNCPIRLFIVDTSQFSSEDNEHTEEIKRVFINARIISECGDLWSFNEGCLSIPDVREDVKRQSSVTIEYFDEFFNKHIETFHGLSARVIQHEYDHIDGILFIDKLSPLRRRMIKRKLVDIAKGKVKTSYKMRFVK